MTPVSPIANASAGLPPEIASRTVRSTGDVPFSQLVSGLLQDANSQQLQVGRELDRLATGESDHIHDLVISAAKADLALRMVLEVRDQLIAAYQEVMRMQM